MPTGGLASPHGYCRSWEHSMLEAEEVAAAERKVAVVWAALWESC